jgi:hypothetical protein
MLGKKSLRIRLRYVQPSDIEPITPHIEVCTCLHWPENLVKNEIFTQSRTGADGKKADAFFPPLTAGVRLLPSSKLALPALLKQCVWL